MALAALAVAFVAWGAAPMPIENPLARDGVEFSQLTNWKGSEGHAELSADGRDVAFLADRDGEVDLFSSRVSEWDPENLTTDRGSLNVPLPLRPIGFTGDGRIWLTSSMKQ